MAFSEFSKALSRAAARALFQSFDTVIEVKYPPSEDIHADRITNHLRFRISRSSKYVDALERIYPFQGGV